MGLLKKTRSLWQIGRTPTSDISAPAPLTPLHEVDASVIPSTEQHPLRRSLQRTSDPPQLVTAENIRELRERIRYRYSLDVEILKHRNIKKFSRGKLEENMAKSVAALADMRKTVQGWDRREFFATDLEYRKFQEIRHRLLGGTKMDWEKNKPWELTLSNMLPLRAPYEMSGRTESMAQRSAPLSSGNCQPTRDRPDDVPFAWQSQVQSQRPSRVSDQNPPQQSRFATDPTRQTQHGMEALRQQQRRAHSSREAPYVTNTTPQMQHAADPVRRSQFDGALPQQDMYALVSPQQSDLSLLSSQRIELGVRSPPPSELAPGSPPPTRYVPTNAHRMQPLMHSTRSAAPYGGLSHPEQSGFVVATPRTEGLRLSRQRDARIVSAPPQIKLTVPTPPAGRRVLSDPSHMSNAKYPPIRMDSPVPEGRVEGPPSSQHSAPGY